MKKLILITFILLTLQGCVFVAGAAAGAAAIAIVYDHRTSTIASIDKQITSSANEQIANDLELSNSSHIIVTSFNQRVLIVGQTPSKRLKEKAGNIVKAVPHIKHIYNQLEISGPTSSLTRTSDAWISTKIKTQMLTVDALKGSDLNVVTENGTVYLMGKVTHKQADVAVALARKVSGVRAVVKVFQYLQ